MGGMGMNPMMGGMGGMSGMGMNPMMMGGMGMHGMHGMQHGMMGGMGMNPMMGGMGGMGMNPMMNGGNSMLPSTGAVTKCQPLAHMKLCTTYDDSLNKLG